MASDGSLKFDTKINTSGFEKGTGELLIAAEKLTAAIDNLSAKMDHAFTSSGTAASTTARQVDEVAEATRKANEEMERLRKEKAATFTGTIENSNAPYSSFPDDGKRYNIYGQDVDAMIAKNRELEAAAREAASTVTSEAQKEKNSVVSLKDSLLYALEVFKRFPGGIMDLFKGAGNAIDETKLKTRNLQDEIDRYQDALYYAQQKGLGLGDAEYDKALKGLTLAKAAAERYKRALLGVDGTQKKASRSAVKMGSSMKRVKKETTPLTKSILKLSNMFKMLLLRMAMRNVIGGIREGFENLAIYSDNTNRAISLLMSGLTQLKNSIAAAYSPVIEYAAPALSKLISLMAEANNQIGQFFAALTGKDSYVKAVAVQEDYAAGLDKANDGLKEEQKNLKKTAYAFDDLIQRQTEDIKTEKDDGRADPSEMFETVKVESDVKALAEDIKKVFTDLFKPIKDSWIQYGPSTMESLKTMFNSAKQLAKNMGASFMEVWKVEGYGKAITDDLLITFSNLSLTVANLIDQFNEAWVSGGTGTDILRHLGDIILEITGFFKEASESLKNWAKELDFSPLLKSFDRILVALRPIVNDVGKALLWLLKDVLEPVAKWGIEQALPAVFDLIAAALEVVHSVIEALKPFALWLWEEFLKPLGEWTGELIIDALEHLVEWLTNFSDWIRENQEEVEIMASVVLGFFTAFKFMEFVSGVKNMLGVLPNLIGTLGGLIGKLNPLTLLLGGIITAAVLVARAWDKMTPQEKLATKIIAVAGAVGLLAIALGSIMSNPLMVSMGFIVAAAAGIAVAGIAISALTRDSSASAYSSRASSYARQGYNLAAQAIPRLATGTVVPPRAGEFAAILGDNNRDYEVVSPLDTMKQAFKEAIAEMGGIGGNQTVKADLIVDGTKFGQLVYKYNNNEKQRVGVRMVMEG